MKRQRLEEEDLFKAKELDQKMKKQVKERQEEKRQEKKRQEEKRQEEKRLSLEEDTSKAEQVN